MGDHVARPAAPTPTHAGPTLASAHGAHALGRCRGGGWGGHTKESANSRLRGVRLVGTVERVVYRDGRFAVLSVTHSGQTVSVSGMVDVACPGMPIDGEVVGRSGHADRQYGEEFKVVTLSDPGRDWRRASGVWAWLSAGGGGVDAAANTLVAAFGPNLPIALTHDKAGVTRALRPMYGDAAERTAESLAMLSLVVLAAAGLGESGLDWVASRLTTRFGTYGPFIAKQDPRSLIGQGVAPVAALARAGVTGSLTELVVGCVEWECRLAVGGRVSKRRLVDAMREAVGDSADQAVTAAIRSGGVYDFDGWVVPAGSALGATSFIRAISQIRPGDLPPGVTLRPGVSCVVAPPGANLAWLSRDLDLLRAGGLRYDVVYPDSRGAVSRLVEAPSESSGGYGNVVVVMDAHRISFATAARLAHDARAARSLVFVGDDWMWCPGQGDSVVAELAAWGGVPVVRLAGSGRAWLSRDLGVDLTHLPGVVVAEPPPDTLRLWRAPASSGTVRVGRTVVLIDAVEGVGPGAVGEVVSAESRAVAHVDFGPGGVHKVRTWRMSSSVPAGWLSGVRVGGLWLTDQAGRDAWIAALAAADTLYVTRKACHVRETPAVAEGRCLLAGVAALACAVDSNPIGGGR